MANEAVFTLTFKTIAELAGLDRLASGLQSGVRRIEEINNRIRTVAATANTALTTAGSFLAVSKLNEYAQMATEAREAQAAFAFTVLRSKEGSHEFLEELTQLNRELAETTDTSEAVSRSVEQQLLIFGVAKKDIADLTRLTIDFAKARGMDVGSVGQMLARSLSGDDVVLTRFGIHLDKTKEHAEQVRDLIKQLEAMVGGTARVMADADGGVTQAEFGWRRLKIAIGDVVNLVRVPFLVALSAGLNDTKRDLDDVNRSTGSWGERVYVTSGLVGEWVRQNFTLIGSIVGVAGALLVMRTGISLLGGPITAIVAVLFAVDAAAKYVSKRLVGLPIGITQSFSLIVRVVGVAFNTCQASLEGIAELFVANVRKIINTAIEDFWRVAGVANAIVKSLSLGKVDFDPDGKFEAQAKKATAAVTEASDAAASGASKVLAAGIQGLSDLEGEVSKTVANIQKNGGGSVAELTAKLLAEYRKYAATKNIDAKPGSGFSAGDAGMSGAEKAKAATEALTQAKFRLASAEQTYKNELEQTKLLEESGLITADQARQRNIESTRAYVAELQRAQAELPKLIAQMEALGNTKGAAELKLQFQDMTNKILQAQSALENTGFFGQMRARLRQLAAEWSNLGKQIGGFLTQQFQNLASTGGQVISDLIFRTGNWRQSILSLGQSFVQTLATMVIQWILSRTIMSALNKLFAKGDAQATNAQASQAAAAWAPAATAASIASYGVAAGTGVAAFLAAMALGTAGAVASSQVGGGAGGFQRGGFTGHGSDSEYAGPAHKNEFYFSAPATRYWGRDFLENLHSVAITRPGFASGGFTGGNIGGAGTGSLGGRGGGNVRVIVVADMKAAAREAMKEFEGQTIITDAVNKRRIQLFGGQ